MKRASLTHREPHPRKADDLHGDTARPTRREVREEDGERLDAHEVANANGRRRVGDNRKHVGEDAEVVVGRIASNGGGNPALVDTGQGREKRAHLAGEDEVEHIGKCNGRKEGNAFSHL